MDIENTIPGVGEIWGSENFYYFIVKVQETLHQREGSPVITKLGIHFVYLTDPDNTYVRPMQPGFCYIDTFLDNLKIRRIS